MAIASLVLLFAVVALCVLLFEKYQPNKPETAIRQLEQRAEFWKHRALEDLLQLGTGLYDFLLNAAEQDYMRLKQRYKHDPDPQRRLQIAQDWADYVYAIYELSHARNLLDVDWGGDAVDSCADSTKAAQITRQEIERRFQEMLGQPVVDRWSQAADADKKRRHIKEQRQSTVNRARGLPTVAAQSPQSKDH